MSIVHQLLNFYDAPAAASFTLPPTEAIAYFKAKGLKVTFDWRDMLGAEHASAFTVAKMADIDMLADVQASLDDAIAQGLSYRTWADTITPLLQQKGWWGRQAVNDPLTGETIVAQLGSPSRLKTIFRTNVQSAYAAGQWQQIQEQKDVAEYLMYDAVDDHRTRPEHAAWDGTILPVDHEWWDTHTPPNGWNCRCGVIQLAAEDLEDLGLTPNAKPPPGGTTEWKNPRTGKTEKVDKGLDPGWNSNPGKTHLAMLQKLAAEKIKAMAPKAAAAAAKGIKAAEAQANDLADKAGISVAQTIDATAPQLAKGAGKAQLRTAQKAIGDALKANTPYVAKAILKLQASKAGKAMDPIELWAKAQAEATKVKDAAALANWKQAQLAGKPGPAAGKAVFDALPEPAQASMLAEIDAKTGAAAAAKAIDDELASILAGDQGPLLKKAAEKLADNQVMSPAEKLAYVKAQPAQLTAGQQAGGIAGWKKNAIAGKPPTEKQQLAFDSLTDKQKAYQLEQVDAAKAALHQDAADALDEVFPTDDPDAVTIAAEIPPGPAPISDAVPDINPSQMRQIGPQKGSNEGGLYVDAATGTEWYVKFPASTDQALNEVLSAKLYQAAGIDVPDVRLVTWPDGRTAVASRMEAGLTKGTPAQLAKGGAFDGFAVDAWLANWDVAGATLDNLLMRGGRAFRVDTGGSLRYRAQGGLKGSAWGDQVTEIQSLRNAGTAPQAAKVFGKMTDEDIAASVAKVAAIDDSTIEQLVRRFGPADRSGQDALIATLAARRADLLRQYPQAAARAKPPADAPDTARVTAREQAEIEASRVNGYTIRTDGDAIEDQNVVVSQITSASGKPVTRLFLKVREAGAKGIAKGMPETVKASTAAGADLSPIRSQMLGLLKSINSRAAKGQKIDPTVSSKWEALREQMVKMDDLLRSSDHGLDAKVAKASQKQLQEMRLEFVEYIRRHALGASKGMPLTPFRMVDIEAFKDIPPSKAVASAAKAKPAGMPWRRGGKATYHVAEFEKANARLTSQTQHLPGTQQHYTIDEPGYRVTYIPAEQNAISSRGVVMIDIDGAGAAASARGFEILEQIGVKATRSTQAERLELYLDRIAYVRTIRNSKLEEAYTTAGKIADPQARADAKLKLLNADAGKDITKSRYWNPEGEHQAFGHGRVLMNRPDLDDAEVAAFAKTHVVYHNTNGLGIGGDAQWPRLKAIIEGGGQISSQIDRMRRGVASYGSSVEGDHQQGGANYIFTRLRTRTSGMDKAGIYWNPERLLRRSDAFTYTGDRYGNVSRSTQEQDRQITPEGWRKAAASRSNETNFRDSLSVFDDVERIVFRSAAEYNEAIGGMRAMGYREWPDGRPLEAVFGIEKKK